MDFGDVVVKKSSIGQFEDNLGVYANRNFKKGEVVIEFNLTTLPTEEFNKLSLYKRENFCHKRDGIIYFYPDPARYVNRSKFPNVLSDIKKEVNIALRDILNAIGK